MSERLHAIKEILLCALEEQLEDLESADAKEMGEVMDMIKDIEEAEYYHAVTYAMKESEPSTISTIGDPHFGKSYSARKSYMLSKENGEDKASSIKELEHFTQELMQDMTEIMEIASPEEKQYLNKKIAVLANKISQMSGT